MCARGKYTLKAPKQSFYYFRFLQPDCIYYLNICVFLQISEPGSENLFRCEKGLQGRNGTWELEYKPSHIVTTVHEATTMAPEMNTVKLKQTRENVCT